VEKRADRIFYVRLGTLPAHRLALEIAKLVVIRFSLTDAGCANRLSRDPKPKPFAKHSTN
jgi:hypothetical protein